MIIDQTLKLLKQQLEQQEAVMKEKSSSMLDIYAAHKDVKSLATAILNDVQQSGQGRKYLVRTVIPACHPHKLKDATIAEKATAKTVTQVANKLLDYFTEHELWHRPGDWARHVDHLIHNGELG